MRRDFARPDVTRPRTLPRRRGRRPERIPVGSLPFLGVRIVTTSATESTAAKTIGYEGPPLILFSDALARALGVKTTSAALRMVKRESIPYLKAGRQIGVRSAALVEWAASRERQTEPRPAPAPVPAAPEWTRALLRTGKSPGLSTSEAKARNAGRGADGGQR